MAPPPLIKCGGCGRNRAEARFSPNQLSIYRKAQQQANATRPSPKAPRCNDCTSNAREELQCGDCNVLYSLEYFNKTQRRYGTGVALCIYCSGTRQDLEAEHLNQVGIEQDIETLERGGCLVNEEFGSSSMSHTDAFSATSNVDTSLSSSRLDGDSNRTGFRTAQQGIRHSIPPSNNSLNTYVSSSASNVYTGLTTITNMNGSSRVPQSSTASRTSNHSGFVRIRAAPEDRGVKAQRFITRDKAVDSEKARQAEHNGDDDSDGSEPAF